MGNKGSQDLVVPTSGRTVQVNDAPEQVVAIASEPVNQIETNDMTSLLVFVWLIVAVVGTVCLTMIFNRICTPKQSTKPISNNKHVIREQDNNK